MLLLLHVVIQKGGTSLSAVVPIVVLRHEAPNSSHWRIFSKTGDFSITFNSVIFQSLQGNGLVDTLDLLWLGVDLLLALLTTSTQPEHQMKSAFFLDIVIAQGTAIFELFAGKDKTLLIRWDSFFILNLGLHIVNGVGRLNIQSDGLAWSQILGAEKATVSVRIIIYKPTGNPTFILLYLPVRVFTKICMV